MSGRGFLWRAVLWVERFLPAPPAVPAARPSAKRSRWVLVMAFLPGALGAVVGYRSHELRLSREWLPLVLGLMLVVIVATLVAAVGFGLKAWRDAHHA